MKTSVLLSILFSFLLLQSCPPVKRVNEASTTSVSKNYEEYCAGCHGKNREQFVDRKWLWGESRDAVFASIKYGNDDDGMPAYDSTFTDAEIYELTDFILSAEAIKMSDIGRKKTSNKDITSEDLNFRLDTLVTGLDNPWGLEFLPDGAILITELSGLMYRFFDGKLIKIEGVPAVRYRNQGGLSDLKLHPNYAENAWLYISFSKPDPSDEGKATTAVVRAKLVENQLTDIEEIFVAKPYVSTTRHYGTRMEFDREGFLYISVGDRGMRDEFPQSLDNHCGKIHRIHDDGRIPSDNPFVNTQNAVTSIWSYGHRNPQGMALHPSTGELWTHEHGPRGGDEINLIEKGANYGWPVISYGINYSGTRFTDITEKDGMKQPVLYWVPSIAPCGMDFVRSEKYGAWQGDILSGSLRFEYLNRSVMEGSKVIREEKLLEDIGRVRVIKSAPDGYIYVGVESPGAVYRIMPI